MYCDSYLANKCEMNNFNHVNYRKTQDVTYKDRFIPDREAKYKYDVLALEKPENQRQDILFKSLFGSISQNESVLFNSSKNSQYNKENTFRIKCSESKPYFVIDVQDYFCQNKNFHPLSFVNRSKLAAALDGECYIVDLNSFKATSKLKSLDVCDEINAISCDPNQQKIVASSFYGFSPKTLCMKNYIYLVDVETDKSINRYQIKKPSILKKIRLEKNLISYTSEGDYIYKDIKTKNSVVKIPIFYDGAVDVISCFEISSDGSAIAFGGLNGRVKIYDVRMMRDTCVREYQSSESVINDIKWHPDNSRQLAIASSNSFIGICYSGFGQFTEMKNITTTGSVDFLLWASPNRLISSQSKGLSVENSDGIGEPPIKIWDVSTKKQVGGLSSGGEFPQTNLLESLDKDIFVCVEDNLSFYKMPKEDASSRKITNIVNNQFDEKNRNYGIRNIR